MSNRLCLIEWHDACSHPVSGWRTVEEMAATEPSVCFSVGWVLADKPGHIVLAAHIGDDEGDGDICIPRGCIVRMVDLVEKLD